MTGGGGFIRLKEQLALMGYLSGCFFYKTKKNKITFFVKRAPILPTDPIFLAQGICPKVNL